MANWFEGTEFQVNTNPENHQMNPAVTKLLDGGYIVVWQSLNQGGDGYDIYAQRYKADGSADGEESKVNTYIADAQTVPAVAVLKDGTYVVTWQSKEQDESGTGIYAQHYKADGSKNGEEFRVNSRTAGSQNSPEIAALADGGYMITWTSSDSYGAFDIHAQKYKSDGSENGGEFSVNTTSSGIQGAPAITSLVDGSYVVTWQSNGQDGELYGIYAQKYKANGSADGTEVLVNTTTAGTQTNPTTTSLSNGGYVIAWQSNDPGSDGYDIYTQRYNADGSKDGSETRVNSTTQEAQSYPSITGLLDGGYVVTWHSNMQDGQGSGVYAQRYDRNGKPDGEETLVNTYTTGEQSMSSVTALTGGGYVVTWHSMGQDGSGYGIYAKTFLPNNPPSALAKIALEVPEDNSTTIITGASDLDGDPLTYAIKEGSAPTKGHVTFNQAAGSFTYTPKADVTGSDRFILLISDGRGGVTEQEVTMVIAPVNDAPVITSNGGGEAATIKVAENTTAVTTAKASDAEGNAVTWSISGADAALFTVNARTGTLAFKAAPDFEAPKGLSRNNVYNLTLVAKDSDGATASQALTVHVTDVNEAPVITSNGGGTSAAIKVAENATAVTAAKATSAGNGTLTWSISGTDAALFTINAKTGALAFKAAPDFEAPKDKNKDNIYDITLTAKDAGGAKDTQALAVSVTNVNEAPVITSNGGGTSAAIKVMENATAVTAAKATDIEKSAVTWSISGTDAALFTINAKTGALAFKAAPDFEAPKDKNRDNVYDIALTAKDAGGATDTQALKVSVRDVADKTLTGTAKADRLIGTPENDTLDGKAGNDLLDGGKGNDTLIGGAGNDTYVVDAAGDKVIEAANAGTDTVKTTLAKYSLGSNVENLTYTGTSAFTGTGNLLDNTITGSAGNDVLSGGAGNDGLAGGAGNDRITGGAGSDRLTGGAGADVFVYTAIGDSTAKSFDTIADFSPKQKDRIDLSAIDANSIGGTKNDAFVFIGTAGFSGTAGELRFKGGVLQGDVNGDKVADLSVKVTGWSSFAASNIIL